MPLLNGCRSAIAAGSSRSLVERAADVALKERRKLVLVPRETPLSAVHLQDVLRLARAGAIVLPAAPGFYHRPTSVDDLVSFVVAHVSINSTWGTTWRAGGCRSMTLRGVAWAGASLGSCRDARPRSAGHLQRARRCRARLHAGDVGGAEVLVELATIAPVQAVTGNTDDPGTPGLSRPWSARSTGYASTWTTDTWSAGPRLSAACRLSTRRHCLSARPSSADHASRWPTGDQSRCSGTSAVQSDAERWRLVIEDGRAEVGLVTL